MTMASSLPLASQRPECAQRTVNTGPVCMASVHRSFGGRPETSAVWLRMGFVLHIRTLASRPPVAMREQSGCTWHENMESRLPWSFVEESGMSSVNASRGVSRAGDRVLTLVGNPCGFCEAHYEILQMIQYAYGSRARVK